MTLAELGLTIARFYETAGRIRNDAGYEPAVTSTAREESSTDEGRHAPYIAYSSAKLQLQSAEDLLMCLVRVLVEPVPQFGHFALTRSVMEQAARAWWLLEPDIGVDERGLRGAAESVNNCNEALRTDAAAGGSDEVRDWVDAAIAQLVAEGYRVSPARGGRLRVEGVVRPTATQLAESFLQEPGLIAFRYYSAVLHGVPYGLVESFAATPAEEADSTHLTPSLSMETVANTCFIACLAHARAFDRQVELYGWPSGEWHECRREGLSAIAAVFAGAA